MAADTYVYPDVMVVCGGFAVVEGHRDMIVNPPVVVEVLSESTERWDRSGKFARRHGATFSDKNWTFIIPGLRTDGLLRVGVDDHEVGSSYSRASGTYDSTICDRDGEHCGVWGNSVETRMPATRVMRPSRLSLPLSGSRQARRLINLSSELSVFQSRVLVRTFFFHVRG